MTLKRFLLAIPLAAAAGPLAAQPMVFLEKCSDGLFLGGQLATEYCSRALATGELSDNHKVLALGVRGQLLLRTGQLEKALADFDEALRLRPEHQEPRVRAMIHLVRGQARFARQLFEQASEDFSEALQLDATLGHAYVGRGHSWLRKGETEKAFADFNEALRQDPLNSFSARSRTSLGARQAADRMKLEAAARYGLGLTQMRLKDYPRAVEELSASTRLEPQSAGTLMARAIALTAMKDFDGAIADLDAVLRMRSRDAVAFYRRGVVHVHKKAFERATDDLDEALRLNPRIREAYVWRSVAWSNRDDYERALADIERAIALLPTDAEAIRMRESLRKRQQISKPD